MSDEESTSPAPVKRAIDWALAERLYLMDQKHSDICEAVGCSPANLAKKVQRAGWRKKKDAALAVAAPPSSPESEPVAVRDWEGRRARAIASTELTKTLETLNAIPCVPSLKVLKTRADVLQKLAGVGESVHDWGKGIPSGKLHLGTLLSAKRPEKAAVINVPAAVTPSPEQAPTGEQTGGS